MKTICILLVAAMLAMPGCITIRTIDERGNEVVETRVDTDAILLCTQLIMTNLPAAIELARQIQAMNDKPAGPDKTEQLAALLEQARQFLIIYNANKT